MCSCVIVVAQYLGWLTLQHTTSRTCGSAADVLLQKPYPIQRTSLALSTCPQEAALGPGSEGAMLAAALTSFFHSLVDCLSSQPASTTSSSKRATGACQRALDMCSLYLRRGFEGGGAAVGVESPLLLVAKRLLRLGWGLLAGAHVLGAPPVRPSCCMLA